MITCVYTPVGGWVVEAGVEKRALAEESHCYGEKWPFVEYGRQSKGVGCGLVDGVTTRFVVEGRFVVAVDGFKVSETALQRYLAEKIGRKAYYISGSLIRPPVPSISQFIPQREFGSLSNK